MNDIINFPPRDSRDHVITDSPMRLRWSDWQTDRILLVHVQAAAVYEDQREECLAAGRRPGEQMPPHFTLSGPLAHLARLYLRFAHDGAKQEEASYLAGLMEALLNTSSDILRTDLIRRVYHEVEELSARLGVRFSGGSGSFMLPLNEDVQSGNKFKQTLAHICDLQEFFHMVKELSLERHRIVARKYVIYYPRQLGGFVPAARD
ncbi:MAG: hypothetical protein KQJ78_02030 [Deltaproteobacteria bacterium]|nr:hypothetical protein [Deltaproteobacteria bacterium]